MESLLGPLTSALVVLFLISVMLSIGLEVAIEDLLSVFKNRNLVMRAVLANLVVVPLLGLGIAKILPMSPGVETGFLLLVAAPGALFAINFTRKMHDSVSFAAALLFLLSILSIAVTPPIAELLISVDQPVTVHYGNVFRVLIQYLVLPLVVGLLLKACAKPVAKALLKPADICAGVSFVAVTILTITVKSAATKKVGANGLAATLLLIVVSMLAGWLFGGPSDGTRRVLAISTSMRNVALCLAIAWRSFPGSDVDAAVIAFSALMLPPNILFTIYQIRQQRRVAAAQPARSPAAH